MVHMIILFKKTVKKKSTSSSFHWTLGVTYTHCGGNLLIERKRGAIKLSPKWSHSINTVSRIYSAVYATAVWVVVLRQNLYLHVSETRCQAYTIQDDRLNGNWIERRTEPNSLVKSFRVKVLWWPHVATHVLLARRDKKKKKKCQWCHSSSATFIVKEDFYQYYWLEMFYLVYCMAIQWRCHPSRHLANFWLDSISF